MFGYEVEIKEHDVIDDWPFDINFDQREILQVLNAFFGHPDMFENKFRIYDVNRPGYGIERAVKVLQNPNNEYYAIRIYIKPEFKSLEVSFDKAAYHQERIRQLFQALREHYPATYFLGTKHLLIILQQFIFSPVCQFTDLIEIKGLLEIIWYASKARILLDYNHNHWLISKKQGLLYVDTDYMGQILPDCQKALAENLNQALVFLTVDNCPILAEALRELSVSSSDSANFVTEYLQVLKRFLDSIKDIDSLSSSLKAKLNCLREISRFQK
jgi:hypothetical protein